ncbi:MAG TPA: hypothetical protein VGB42_07265 [Candidatus Thermoplasmatota archaeon]
MGPPDSRWVTARLSLGGAVVGLLTALALFAPADLRAKLMAGSLALTLVALVTAALKGNRATYRAAAFCASGSLLIVFASSFAGTQNLAHLALAGAAAVGLVVSSLPRGRPPPVDPPPAPAT